MEGNSKPAAGLAGIHVRPQLLQLVILRQLGVMTNLLEVPHALGLSKDMQGTLLQPEAAGLCCQREGALLTRVVLK